MPRPHKVTLRKSTNPARTNKPWELDISKGLSQSGKREFQYFETRAAAEREQRKILEDRPTYGLLAVHIGPDLAAEAMKQADRLRPYEASLREAVDAFIAMRDRQEASVSFAKGWKIYQKLKENRSEAQFGVIRRIGKSVPPAFSKKLVCDIQPEGMQGLLRFLTSGPHRRNQYRAILHNFFREMIFEGYRTENPVDRVRCELQRHLQGRLP